MELAQAAGAVTVEEAEVACGDMHSTRQPMPGIQAGKTIQAAVKLSRRTSKESDATQRKENATSTQFKARLQAAASTALAPMGSGPWSVVHRGLRVTTEALLSSRGTAHVRVGFTVGGVQRGSEVIDVQRQEHELALEIHQRHQRQMREE